MYDESRCRFLIQKPVKFDFQLNSDSISVGLITIMYCIMHACMFVCVCLCIRYTKAIIQFRGKTNEIKIKDLAQQKSLILAMWLSWVDKRKWCE